MNDKIRKFKDEGEALEEGLSNRVYASENKVLKVYTLFPFTSFYATFLEFITGNWSYISRIDRMTVEKDILQYIENTEVKSPEILELGDDYIIFERIEGSSGYEYLNQCTELEANEFGQKAKKFLIDLHSQNVALRDARVSNFIISDEVYSIDHEYGSLDAGRFFFFIDELTVTSSARQTENYIDFIEGFQPGKLAVILSVFMAIYHSILFERNFTRFKHIFSSLKQDFLNR